MKVYIFFFPFCNFPFFVLLPVILGGACSDASGTVGMVFSGSQGRCPSRFCTLGLPPGLDLDAYEDVITQFYDTLIHKSRK